MGVYTYTHWGYVYPAVGAVIASHTLVLASIYLAEIPTAVELWQHRLQCRLEAPAARPWGNY